MLPLRILDRIAGSISRDNGSSSKITTSYKHLPSPLEISEKAKNWINKIKKYCGDAVFSFKYDKKIGKVYIKIKKASQRQAYAIAKWLGGWPKGDSCYYTLSV